MSESMSRYSIVERLADKKMALIEERDTLQLEAAKAKQDVEFRKKNIDKDKKSILEKAKLFKAASEKDAEIKYVAAIAQAQRDKEAQLKETINVVDESNKYVDKVDRDLEESEMLAKNLDSNLEVKKKSINTKIITIDEALKRLEEISKTAPQN